MADVKISLTGNELAELRLLLQVQEGKLDEVQIKIVLKMLGYTLEHCTMQEQLVYLAAHILVKLG